MKHDCGVALLLENRNRSACRTRWVSPAEDPDVFWKPVLNLGPPAHHWVERFFWQWFTDGAQAAETPEAFTNGRCPAPLKNPKRPPASPRLRGVLDVACTSGKNCGTSG